MKRKQFKQTRLYHPIFFIVSAFLLGFTTHDFTQTPTNISSIYHKNTQICFTPAKACQKLILDYLSKAQKTIHVQAYSFTDREIVNMLVAKKKQGAEVSIILDKSNKKDPQKLLRILKQNNIPIQIDPLPGIAHNKIMIVDDESIITGSYNFSVAAYKRNAENVLILKDINLAQQYKKNWQNRWSISSKF